MPLRLCIIRLCIVSFVLLAACQEDAPALGPNEKILQALLTSGFAIKPGRPDTHVFNRMMDYVATECYQVRYHITDLKLCFHHFKTKIKALEAKSFMEKTKWPSGRFWTASVWRNSVVQANSQLKDRPVAIKLISFFH